MAPRHPGSLSKLFARLLFPLLFAVGPVLSQQTGAYGGYGPPADQFSEPGFYPVPYAWQDGRMAEWENRGTICPQQGGTDWPAYDPGGGPYSIPGSSPFSGGIPNEGFRSYRAARGAAGDQWDPPLPSDMAGAPAYDGSPWGGPVAGGRAASSGRYRFRGEGPGAQGAPPWRYGYRFRPLTEQERLRMGAGTGWRPRSQYPGGERLRRAEPLLGEEVYGYQPDNWFPR